MMKIDSCVIAVPWEDAYEGLSRAQSIKSYEQMSGPGFSAQLMISQGEEIVLEKSEIAVLNGPLSDKRIVRTVAPFNHLDVWYNRPAKRSMLGSLIYTERDGFPIAEYCAVRNNSPDTLDIANDIADFYKRFGWDAEVYKDERLFPKSDKKSELSLQSVEKNVIAKISEMINNEHI